MENIVAPEDTITAQTLKRLEALARAQGIDADEALTRLLDAQTTAPGTKMSVSAVPELCASIAEWMSEGMVIHDSSGSIIFANPAASRILGLTHAQLIGRDSVDTRWRTIYSDGSPFPGEAHPAMVTLRTGTILKNVVMGVHRPDTAQPTWINISTRKGTLGVDEQRVVIVTFSDITPLQQTRNELQRSEAEMRAVLDNLPGTIVTLDRDCTILSMYSAIARRQNLDFEQHIGGSIAAIVRPDTMGFIREGVDYTFDTYDFFEFESKSLTDRWYVNRIAPIIQDGEVVAAVMNSIDITDRVKMEHAFYQSESRMRSLLQSFPGVILTTNRDGEILSSYSAEREGMNMLDTREILTLRQHENLLSGLHDQIRQSFDEKRSINREYQHDDATWYDVRTAPIFDNSSNVEAITLISLDIQERKLLEQRALDLALERERVQILYNFITTAGHEFRTPLSVMNSSLYMLKRMPESPQREQRIGIIEEQVSRLSELVDDLLKMARLDSNTDFKFAPIHINELLDRVIVGSDNALRQRGHLAYLHVTPDLPEIMGDVAELTIVLRAIMDNAIRYTPDGGTIILESRFEDGMICVRIRDNGIGIAKEELPHVFKRFYRVDKSHSTRGFGLGLSIAKKIITAHDGIIDIDSILDEGTTVTVLLPLR